jgi:hypothetical protein
LSSRASTLGFPGPWQALDLGRTGSHPWVAMEPGQASQCPRLSTGQCPSHADAVTVTPQFRHGLTAKELGPNCSCPLSPHEISRAGRHQGASQGTQRNGTTSHSEPLMLWSREQSSSCQPPCVKVFKILFPASESHQGDRTTRPLTDHPHFLPTLPAAQQNSQCHFPASTGTFGCQAPENFHPATFGAAKLKFTSLPGPICSHPDLLVMGQCSPGLSLWPAQPGALLDAPQAPSIPCPPAPHKGDPTQGKGASFV